MHDANRAARRDAGLSRQGGVGVFSGEPLGSVSFDQPFLRQPLDVADLDVEVRDERGSTTAHLMTDDYGLVLEVADPATLLRCVPGRGLRRNLPFSLPLARLANVPVRLTTRGHELGRVHLSLPRAKFAFAQHCPASRR